MFIVERRTLDGSRSALLAHKRYRPTKVSHKGELAGARVHPRPQLRQRRQVPRGPQVPPQPRGAGGGAHDRPRQADPRRALAGPGARHARRGPTRPGVTVPYPVEFTGDGMLMQLLGDDGVAAPRLVNARLDADAAARAPSPSCTRSCVALTRAGLVHADLSPYNVLWWRDRLWPSTSRRPSTSSRTRTASTCSTTTSPRCARGSRRQGVDDRRARRCSPSCSRRRSDGARRARSRGALARGARSSGDDGRPSRDRFGIAVVPELDGSSFTGHRRVVPRRSSTPESTIPTWGIHLFFDDDVDGAPRSATAAWKGRAGRRRRRARLRGGRRRVPEPRHRRRRWCGCCSAQRAAASA